MVLTSFLIVISCFGFWWTHQHINFLDLSSFLVFYFVDSPEIDVHAHDIFYIWTGSVRILLLGTILHPPMLTRFHLVDIWRCRGRYRFRNTIYISIVGFSLILWWISLAYSLYQSEFLPSSTPLGESTFLSILGKSWGFLCEGWISLSMAWEKVLPHYRNMDHSQKFSLCILH